MFVDNNDYWAVGMSRPKAPVSGLPCMSSSVASSFLIAVTASGLTGLIRHERGTAYLARLLMTNSQINAADVPSSDIHFLKKCPHLITWITGFQ